MKVRSTAIALIASAALIGGAVAPAAAAPSAGSLYQAPAKKPKITKQPASASTASGKTASFSVRAKGTSIKYQWYVKKAGSKKWSKASGSTAKKATYKVKASSKNNGYSYRVVLRNGHGKTTSKTVKLVTNLKPKLTKKPANASVAVDKTATFSVKASGGALKYQWYMKKGSGSWKKASGSTAKKSSFKVKASTSNSGSLVRVKVSNKKGSVWSATVKLTTETKPVISKQPQSVTLNPGERASFTVAASGNGLKYQWQRRIDGETAWKNIPNATQNTYTFTVRQINELDDYRVVITNKAGSVTSAEATLFVVSTMQHPMPLEKWFVLRDWDARFYDPYQEPSPETYGFLDMYIGFSLFNSTEFPMSSVDTLAIGYQGNDGVYYPGYFLTDDDIVLSGLVTGGSAYAEVPTSAAKGGNWVITELDTDVQYVIGAR